ncbi:MAG: regulatory protein ArsR [Candidatus Parvarchaeum acidophilus ARMAN-5]|uniref:Regulatory protein ArsR n=1 Tax=Candidatus Parvarchaeum acidophilus ARMAN-5 TaxID=662762 RepID=D6GUB4_PARA5|nr:MAG: regulatory protein ArsR [Candidatus Parvarchaeum acidophilus ARMAN-5]
MKLKENDIKILDMLRDNKSVKIIAKELSLPQSTVYYHFNRLKKNGFIQCPKVKMDYKSFDGDEMAMILVSLQSVHMDNFDKFLDELGKESIIQEVFEVSGDWDFIFMVRGSKESIINFVHEKLQHIQNVKKIQSIFIMRHVKL